MFCCAVCVRYGVYLRVNTVQSFTVLFVCGTVCVCVLIQGSHLLIRLRCILFEFITYNFGNINTQKTSAILRIPDKLSWWQHTVRD